MHTRPINFLSGAKYASLSGHMHLLRWWGLLVILHNEFGMFAFVLAVADNETDDLVGEVAFIRLEFIHLI